MFTQFCKCPSASGVFTSGSASWKVSLAPMPSWNHCALWWHCAIHLSPSPPPTSSHLVQSLIICSQLSGPLLAFDAHYWPFSKNYSFSLSFDLEERRDRSFHSVTLKDMWQVWGIFHWALSTGAPNWMPSFCTIAMLLFHLATPVWGTWV